jgi:hypothetical protein
MAIGRISLDGYAWGAQASAHAWFSMACPKTDPRWEEQGMTSALLTPQLGYLSPRSAHPCATSNGSERMHPHELILLGWTVRAAMGKLHSSDTQY